MLLLLFGQSFLLSSGGVLSWSTLAARSRIDGNFRLSIVDRGSRRFDNRVLNDFVEMIRERVATGVDVDGGVESADEDGFSDASPDPILLMVHDGNVLLAEVVALLLGMLQHG